MTNDARLPRSFVIELCRILGHDPNDVTAINIYPNQVSVTYDHFISDTPYPDVSTLGAPFEAPDE